MRTLHGIFDVNNDGVISFDDFEYLSKKFDDLGHLSEEEKSEFSVILRVMNLIRCDVCDDRFNNSHSDFFSFPLHRYSRPGSRTGANQRHTI